MGRKPIGKQALSSAERQRRFLDKIRGTGARVASSLLEAECVKLKGENATLKGENLKLQRSLEEASCRIKKLEAKRDQPAPEPEAPGTVLEPAKRKVVKLELTPKEFKILQRAINPECQSTEESNAAVMFIQSFKERHSFIKEIPQLY